MKNIVLFFTKNADIAEWIFNTIGLGSPLTKYQRIVVKIYTYNCKSRQDVLDVIIKLCSEPKTAKQRYYLAMAYAWSNKEYRDKDIHYLHFYLDNELYNVKTEEQRLTHLSNIYRELANKYEQTYQFEEALKYCRMSNDYILKYINGNKKNGIDSSFMIPTRIYESQLLVKMNRLDEAIKVLNTSKDISIYKYDTIFKDTIDNALEDLYKKKEKGYIYKPRKK